MSTKHTAPIKLMLATRGALSAQQIAGLAGVSQPTVSRALAGDPDIVRIGAARGARYALSRPLRGGPASWSLYRIDDEGRPAQAGVLRALQQGQFLYQPEPDANAFRYLLTGSVHPSLFPDLPWFLEDMRPQGYIGRLFAHSHGPALGIGTDPQRWTADESLTAILEFGSDTPGNFVLGEKAIDAFQSSKLRCPVIESADRPEQYDLLARHIAEDGELPNSSAGGEQPKFATCVRREDGRFSQVLVKFSGSKRTETGRRWADLLRAEALASRVLAAHGLPSAPSSLIETSERAYLEVERFDRAGQFGRLGTISLRDLVAENGGALERPWRQTAVELARGGWLARSDADLLVQLDWFGQLIGNTDMHYGNISLFLAPDRPLPLCPTYDMLPMRFAPTRAGDLPTKTISPPLPRPEEAPLWRRSAEAALAYWRALADDPAIDEAFRPLAQASLAIVESQREAIR